MGFFHHVFGRKPERRATSQPKTMARLPGPGTFQLDIVGESHFQDNLEKLCRGRCEDGHDLEIEAMLIHDDENEHDDQAVAVFIDSKLVGHLGRKNARNFRAQLAAAGAAGVPAVCEAKIVGGWDRGEDDQGHFGVMLDLPTN